MSTKILYITIVASLSIETIASIVSESKQNCRITEFSSQVNFTYLKSTIWLLSTKFLAIEDSIKRSSVKEHNQFLLETSVPSSDKIGRL